ARLASGRRTYVLLPAAGDGSRPQAGGTRKEISMTRVIVAIVFAVLALAVPAFGLSPGTMGQPNQSCQNEPTGPPGLESTTNGFATRAVNVYAGSFPDAHSLVSGNPNAVSQYDVACFEVSSRPNH